MLNSRLSTIINSRPIDIAHGHRSRYRRTQTLCAGKSRKRTHWRPQSGCGAIHDHHSHVGHGSLCRADNFLAKAGAQLVRLTAQGVAHAANLAEIHKGVRAAGYDVPLVADIHFNPNAAFEAARHVEKVRINPGNFFDPGRTFRKMEFSDEEYAAELANIREKFIPFIELCRNNCTAIRIGVNHGSLSDRIMSRFGDGAEGMVESAMEYLRICRSVDYTDVVVSIKASDVQVMTETVRLLASRMAEENMHFPIHLGVTEAGNALEGRVKSAVGIGSLLADGIGDTIRVSLSEAPENEIPAAKAIAAHAAENLKYNAFSGTLNPGRRGHRRPSREIDGIGGDKPTAIVCGKDVPEDCDVLHLSTPGRIAWARNFFSEVDDDTPALIIASYPEIADRDELIMAAAADLGTLLLDGYQDGIGLRSPLLREEEAADICRAVVQATGLARYKAEIVACPGCGRTLFELPEVLDKVKEAFGHLRHLKIAVMGCIVNGPGEMAGADYGYVGAAHGKISLYRGLECVEKNIPQEEAVAHLRDLIESDGQWREKS